MVKTVVPPLQRALPKDSLGGRFLAVTLQTGGQGLARAKQVAADLRAVDPGGFFEKRLGRASRHTFAVAPLVQPAPLSAHQASVDIIVCVHNALDDVTRCLSSVLRYTRPPPAHPRR